MSTTAPDIETSPIIFSTSALTKVYQMGVVEVQALRGIDMEIYAGEVVVLLGASGSGKSTLVNILGGLDTATAGHVQYRDVDLTHASESELTNYRRLNVGFVFQFYNLIPSLTARENVAIVTEIAEHPMEPEEALALVDLQDRMDHFPAQLSGGEQQRVAIARAVAKNPDVLLCDEPTGALDSKTGIVVLKALQKVYESLGTATILITHNVVIGGMADRIISLHDGKIAGIRENEQKVSPDEMEW
ncbi:ABC transporter ATP-binding protein [Halalkalibaculum sp. DA3122]|uniref:ABC transporter ATP-binding protein n=1 Tax=unclassified Halalkalibaculum TaxID=2964617 RepID=UPI0037550748